MENNTPIQPQLSMALPDGVRHCLSGRVPADDNRAIRVVAASAQSWPELTSLSIDEVTIGDDHLIRFALWSASRFCAALSNTRRVTLLVPERNGEWEIRCLVMANASLMTPRPLSGFLLKSVELLGGWPSRGTPGCRDVHHAPEDIRKHAGETRHALFDAFPADDGVENASPGGAHAV